MTIIFDLDDVLANLRESLYQTLTQVTGVDLHWRHWQHYDLRQHYSTIAERLDEVLICERTLEACHPEPGAVAVTRALHELGYELAIVTARGWHPQAEAITREWLYHHRITYDHLSVVPLGGNKLTVLTPFRDIMLAVDDHPSHIARYQTLNIPTLLMDRPWNALYPGERIYHLETALTWAEARISKHRSNNKYSADTDTDPETITQLRC